MNNEIRVTRESAHHTIRHAFRDDVDLSETIKAVKWYPTDENPVDGVCLICGMWMSEVKVPDVKKHE